MSNVLIEYAPAPASEYLGDRTSFDAFVAYTRLGSAPAFLGIETKLTEPFSQGEHQKLSYQRLTERDGSLWREDAWATMSSSEWNQLWRNHLLVDALCQHPRALHGTRGRSVLIRHPGDPSVEGVVTRYRSCLTTPEETFCDWTLDRVVDAFASACETDDERTWIDAFRVRYLDLSASDEAWRERGRPLSLVPTRATAPAVPSSAPTPPAEPVEAVARPLVEFGDGVWEVGVDIEPGVYVATSVDDCYWERMSDFTGDGILANEVGDRGRHLIVEILATDAGFKSHGCGMWRRCR